MMLKVEKIFEKSKSEEDLLPTASQFRENVPPKFFLEGLVQCSVSLSSPCPLNRSKTPLLYVEFFKF